MTLLFRCKDDPEANGRKPLPGDQRFTLTFALDSGVELKVQMGRDGMAHFQAFIAQMMIDDSDDFERESGLA